MQTGGGLFTRFALDADPMGNLVWCSDVRAGSGRSGQLVFGAHGSTPAPARRSASVGDRVFYKGDAALPPGPRRLRRAEVVTPEPMTTGSRWPATPLLLRQRREAEAFLKRFPLADAGRVETLAAPTRTTLPPARGRRHARLRGGRDGILRAPGGRRATQPEMFWRDAGARGLDAGADRTARLLVDDRPRTGDLLPEAQVWRQPKAGGAVACCLDRRRALRRRARRAGRRTSTRRIAPRRGTAARGPTQVLRIRL